MNEDKGGTGGTYAGDCPECGISIYVSVEFLTLQPMRMSYTCPACEKLILE